MVILFNDHQEHTHMFYQLNASYLSLQKITVQALEWYVIDDDHLL